MPRLALRQRSCSRRRRPRCFRRPPKAASVNIRLYSSIVWKFTVTDDSCLGSDSRGTSVVGSDSIFRFGASGGVGGGDIGRGLCGTSLAASVFSAVCHCRGGAVRAFAEMEKALGKAPANTLTLIDKDIDRDLVAPQVNAFAQSLK